MRVAYSVQMSAVNVINALPIVLVLLIGARRVVAGDLTGGPNPTGRQGVLATSSSLFPPAAALLDPSPLPG